jgi:hypothetical protein
VTSKTYGVTNVEQLVARFEMRARIAEKVHDSVTAKAWRDAAEMVRSTVFWGWEEQGGEDEDEGYTWHAEAA